MRRLIQPINHFYQRHAALLILLLFAVVLHIGTTVSGRLYADDYIHAALFSGSQNLAEKQLTLHSEPAELLEVVDQQFNFYDNISPTSSDAYQAYKNYGALPWWSSNDAMLHFFRPLATLTHYIDYQLWPNNSHMMQAVNLLWYVLGLLAIYACYRAFDLPEKIAMFALFLVVLDHSFFQVVSWVAARNMLMAIAFSFVAILAYHKSIKSSGWYAIALLALLAALLSAEGGVVACCYLGAYLFVIDQRAWFKRVLHIIPFVLLVLAWQWYYQQQGYGSSGIDFYMDPARAPLEFLTLASVKIWSNFFELWSGIDVISGQIRPDLRSLLSILGAVILFLLLFLGIKKQEGQTALSTQGKFFLLGSLFALVPGLAVGLSPRVMIFPYIGLSVVFAELLFMPARKVAALSIGQLFIRGFFNAYTAGIHIVLSLVLALVVLIITLSSSSNKSDFALGGENIGDKNLIIISTAQPFKSLFLAHELDAKQQDLPRHSRVLSTNWYDVNVERVSEFEIKLSSSPAFQFDTSMLVEPSSQHHVHSAYLMQKLLGLVRSSNDVWRVADEVVLPEVTIRVEKVVAINGVNKPSVLGVKFTQPLSSYQFIVWNINKKSYQSFHLPKVGENVKVEGWFSPHD